MQFEHETCSTISGTPVQAILDQKSLTRLAQRVREGLKYGLECASSNVRNGLNLASEPSLGPEMGQGPQKWTQINQGQLGGQFRFHSIYLGSL